MRERCAKKIIYGEAQKISAVGSAGMECGPNFFRISSKKGLAYDEVKGHVKREGAFLRSFFVLTYDHIWTTKLKETSNSVVQDMELTLRKYLPPSFFHTHQAFLSWLLFNLDFCSFSLFKIQCFFASYFFPALMCKLTMQTMRGRKRLFDLDKL